MGDSTPSRLSNLKEIVNLLSLSMQAQKEISEILSDFEVRIYALEEDRRRLLAAVRALEDKSRLNDKRYSEVLYKLSDIQ